MIDSAIESRLAEALAAEAGTIPAEASQRLAGIDYHPRSSRVSARRLGAMGGAAGVAAAVAAAALMLTSATPAFAGWTPTPAKATPAQLAGADSACAPELNALAPDAGWAPVTTDVDGPFTLVVDEASSQDYATCFYGSFVLAQVTLISGPSAGQSLSSAANFGPQPTFVSTAQSLNDSAGLETFTSDLYTTTSQENYTLVNGQVASDVTSVSLTLSNGQTVGTSLGGGWLITWWPGAVTAVSATVTTPSGTSTVPLNSPSASVRHDTK
jgi:hypothetical protein